MHMKILTLSKQPNLFGNIDRRVNGESDRKSRFQKKNLMKPFVACTLILGSLNVFTKL